MFLARYEDTYYHRSVVKNQRGAGLRKIHYGLCSFSSVMLPFKLERQGVKLTIDQKIEAHQQRLSLQWLKIFGIRENINVLTVLAQTSCRILYCL